MMPAREMETLLRRYLEEVWHRRNPDAADDFLATGFRRHLSADGDPLTRDGQKALLRTVQAAFPDAAITLEDVLIDGDKIAFRSTFRGPHLGNFREPPPT